MRSRQPWRAVITMAAALTIVPACKEEAATRVPAEGEPARRAAQSFVHCIEQAGAGCVKADPKLGAWDAFSLLGWLASGSPLSILYVLPRELEHHSNAKSVERRFVEQVARYREPVRGAECRTERVDKLGTMVPKLVQAVQTRLTSMGLWNGELETVVRGLASEAAGGLGTGYLVSLKCHGDPWELYVATTTEDQRQVVVGMLTSLPEFLGGTAPSRDTAAGQLGSISIGDSSQMRVVTEGTIDAWIDIPVEEF